MINKIKKLFINGISVQHGGSDTYLRNLLPIICKKFDGEITLLIRTKRSSFFENIDNLKIIKINDELLDTVKKRLFFEHMSIPLLFKKSKADIFWQVDEMLSPGVSLLQKPTISVFHTSPFALTNKINSDGLFYNWYIRMIRKYTGNLTTVPVTVSFHAKAEFSGIYPKARGRFSVIYHGIDTNHFSPATCTNQNNNIKITSPFILSISNRFVWKNYYRLIEAFNLAIMKENLDLDLVIIGESKSKFEDERIRGFINKNGLNERIHIIDYIDQNELPNIYRMAKAYIFPSLVETFGMTILEAMACGVPVACSRWGPIPEIAGDSVLYFNPLDILDISNSIISICTDSDLQNKLISSGLSHVKLFTWEKAANDYLNILGNIEIYQRQIL